MTGNKASLISARPVILTSLMSSTGASERKIYPTTTDIT